MSKKHSLRLTSRDYDIFQFLWRWKYVSTKALSTVFFNGKSHLRGYSRLRELKNAGFINTEFVRKDCEDKAWCLSTKGYKKIEEYLPELENPGFRAENPHHDFLVSCVHIGNWLLGSPDGCSLFSEQQMRRYNPDLYPDWVPECDYYRPDGYWYIEHEDEPKVITLEVELTQKTQRRYEKVADFYKLHPEVTSGIWVVPNKPSAKRLLNSLCNENPKGIHQHQFLLVKDILRSNWDSPIVLGSFQGCSLKEFIAKQGVYTTKTTAKHVSDRHLIDTQIFPKKSRAYSSPSKIQISD